MLTAQNIAFWGFMVMAIILLGFAAIVLWKIFENQISLLGLLAEPTESDNRRGEPKASLSRFQFLIFTFVVAGLLPAAVDRSRDLRGNSGQRARPDRHQQRQLRDLEGCERVRRTRLRPTAVTPPPVTAT